MLSRLFGVMVVMNSLKVQLCSFLLWNSVSGFADQTDASNVILKKILPLIPDGSDKILVSYSAQ